MDIQKNHDIFDFVKFILSILIVSLHSGIVPDILIPVVRTAVPLFFIISSYLLFSKRHNMTEIQRGGVHYIDLSIEILSCTSSGQLLYCP